MSRSRIVLTVFATGMVLGGVGLIACAEGSTTPEDALEDAFERADDAEYMSVVARVNGEEIEGQIVALYSLLQAANWEGVLDDERPAELATDRQILDSLIEDELAYQEAARRGLLCDPDEVRAYADKNLSAVSDEVLRSLADGLGVDPEGFADAPIVVDGYARDCAVSRLRDAVTPSAARGDLEAVNQVWREFKTSLRSVAQIEILDPALR